MIGVYYYPEQWPEEQWERDIQNIAKHGMKHIHLAEFAWCHLEPEEGRFDFSWLDTVVQLASDNGLDIVLCTPTATPPIWMTKNYPEILMVKETQTRVTHGSRAHRCVNSKVFQQFSSKIGTELAQRYGDHPSVIGWQLDNEIGHYANGGCWCDSCTKGFVEFLRDKYGNIENLNRNWAGDFWSQNYQSFEQIDLPNHYDLPYLPNEHAVLDFKTFHSLSLSRYLEEQSAVLKKHIADRMWVTHNFMKDDPFHFAGHVKKGLDMYTLTIYPVAGLYKGVEGRELHRLGSPYNIALNHDRTRSHNGRWGIMEQQPGQVNWGPHNLRPYPGTTRLWLWTALAHGAEFLDTYRYRQPLAGCEQYHEGITTLDGVELSAGGADFVQTAAELEQFHKQLLSADKKGEKKQERIALCFDWNSLTALSIHPQSESFDPWQGLEYFYAACKRLGLAVDIIYSENIEKIFEYKLACTAFIDLAEDDLVEELDRFVEQGGHLILSARSFSRLANGHFPEQNYCNRLEQLSGCTFKGYDVLLPGHEGILHHTKEKRETVWNIWAEQVEPPVGADILATYANQFYLGDTAAFTGKRGAGRVSYIGVVEETAIEMLMRQCVQYTFTEAELLPENCIFMGRGDLGIFLNYNDSPVTVPEHLFESGKLLLGSEELAPAEVALIDYS